MAVIYLMLLTVQVQAGIKVSGEPVRLISAVESHFMNPVFSPDGTLLAFTTDNYAGLWIARSDGGSIAQISQDAGAGFGFRWSNDGSALIARVSRFDGAIRSNAIKLFDLAGNSERLLTGFKTGFMGLPQWSTDDRTVYFFDQDKLSSASTGLEAATLEKRPAQPSMILQVDRLDWFSPEEGITHGVPELAGEKVINLSTSPDGARMAFEILGGPMCVIDADGRNLIRLGKGDRPRWSPHGDYLLYMITNDDGHQITGSDLYVIRTDGSGFQALTNSRDVSEMDPCWSPDGTHIVYDVYETGNIEQLTVTIQ